MRTVLIAIAAVAISAVVAAVAFFATGCTPQQQATLKADTAIAVADFHAAATGALGIVTAAIENPELTSEITGALQTALDKAAPEDAPAINAALAHVNVGELTEAQTILKKTVKKSAPPAVAAAASPAPAASPPAEVTPRLAAQKRGS